MHILNVYCKRVFKKKSSHILMCGFQNSNIDICKNKPQKYATKIPTTKQKGIHTLHQFIVSKPNTAHATKFFLRLLFHSSHFSFLVTFGDDVTKIQKYYVIFVYILQGKMGNTKNQKTKMNFQLLDVWAWNSITSCASISIIWLLGWTIQVEIPFCDNYAICSTQTVVYYFLWCWSSSRIRWIFSFWLAGVVKRLLRWLGLLRFYLEPIFRNVVQSQNSSPIEI